MSSNSADVIVVGGGVMGAAAAFFLCDRGEKDVLVLERDQLGAGTTKGGLGGIRHQFVDELDVRMSQLDAWVAERSAGEALIPADPRSENR